MNLADRNYNNMTLAAASAVLLLSMAMIRFWSPYGIAATPVILPAYAAILMFIPRGGNLMKRTLFLYLLVALNDIGIKLFAPGTHDMVGQAWVNLTLWMGLVPTYFILILGVLLEKDSSAREKWMAVCVFPALIGFHWFAFHNLGLGISLD